MRTKGDPRVTTASPLGDKAAERKILHDERLLGEPDEIAFEDDGAGKGQNTSHKPFDIIQTYLHEIGKIPLLRPHEELRYAKIFAPYCKMKSQCQTLRGEALRLSRYAQDTRSKNRLGQVQKKLRTLETALRKVERSPRFAAIMDAKERFTKANLRLVVAIAKKYARSHSPSFDLNDLIDTGNIGLMKAVERFDPNRGCKFSTYGTWWIRQAITRWITDNNNTVRLPVHISEKIRKYRRRVNALEQQSGQPLDQEERQRAFGMSTKEYEKMQQLTNIGTLSLDTPVETDDGHELAFMDLIEDETPRIDEQHENDCRTAAIRHELMNLSAREREILCYRFGISIPECGIIVEGEHTLEEVGRRFALSRQRIYQIQVKTLKILAARARRSLFQAFAHR